MQAFFYFNLIFNFTDYKRILGRANTIGTPPMPNIVGANFRYRPFKSWKIPIIYGIPKIRYIAHNGFRRYNIMYYKS